jgi:hypothetical protein
MGATMGQLKKYVIVATACMLSLSSAACGTCKMVRDPDCDPHARDCGWRCMDENDAEDDESAVEPEGGDDQPGDQNAG